MTTLKYPHNIFVVTPYLKKKFMQIRHWDRYYFRKHYLYIHIVTWRCTFYVAYIIAIYDRIAYNLRGHLPTIFETPPKFEGP